VQVRVKLMGMLKAKMPSGGVLEIRDGATIDDVLHALAIPAQTVQVFTVNGRFERDRGRALATNDELAVIPPVGGG